MTTPKPPCDDFEEFASLFVGKECWSVSAGVVGSIFYIDLGDKVQLPSSRKQLAAGRQPAFRGEFVVEAHSAAWRLDDAVRDCVMATSDDDGSPDGPILRALTKLIGMRISEINVRRPGLDCCISFDDELALNVFPVAAQQSSYDYALWRDAMIYMVGPYSKLTIGGPSSTG
jgi:hypothetical protein